MKTLVYSVHYFDRSFLEEASQDHQELSFTDQPLNEDTAILANGFEAIALFTSDNASASILEKLHAYKVKFIVLRSVGFDHVDLKKAHQIGIKVANAPAYSPHAIAEHAVTLLLALNRKIIIGQQLMSQNDFRLDKLVGFDLHNKIIGIVGTGKIGATFAKIMHGFGCQLLGYDIETNNALIAQTNIVYTSLEELCKNADVISLNCPQNKDTLYMFNKSIFSLMKHGVVFINTARGGIVNTKDLIEAIDNGTISAAGLDVYENEKAIFFHNLGSKKIEDTMFEKLRSYPNVLITGHQAFLTKEALQGIAETTIANLCDFENNRICKNEI